MKIIYLAGPYSHIDPKIAEGRYHQLCIVADRLIGEGYCVVAPVIFGHPLVQATGRKADWTTWEAYCTALLKKSDEMVVVRLPGWTESVGTKAEIDLAYYLNIPTRYVDAP